jgi:hypothetical protein
MVELKILVLICNELDTDAGAEVLLLADVRRPAFPSRWACFRVSTLLFGFNSSNFALYSFLVAL